MEVIAMTIFISLFTGTVAVEHQLRHQTSAELLNNRKRVRSWWIMAGLLLLGVYGGPISLRVLVVPLIFRSVYEASLLLRSRHATCQYLFTAALLIANEAAIYFLPKALPASVLLPWVLITATYVVSHRTAVGKYLIYAHVALSLLAILAIAPLADRASMDARSLALFLFLATALNDVFQYVTGKWLGRRPLAPALSPNKTLEGALGGVMLSGVVSIIVLPDLLDISTPEACLVGCFLSVIGILGDLHISRLKRAAGVKDTGNAIPGHGGVLDRVDSLTFTAPGFCLCLLFLAP